MTKEFKFSIDVKYVRYEREEFSVSCNTEEVAIQLAKEYVSNMRKEFSNGEYVENFIISEESTNYYEYINMEGDIIV
jgi:hypothetical protein